MSKKISELFTIATHSEGVEWLEAVEHVRLNGVLRESHDKLLL
jgi:hypothetical protein